MCRLTFVSLVTLFIWSGATVDAEAATGCPPSSPPSDTPGLGAPDSTHVAYGHSKHYKAKKVKRHKAKRRKAKTHYSNRVHIAGRVPQHFAANLGTGQFVNDSFASKADGPITTADTGQTYLKVHNGTDGEMEIIGGKLTNTASAASPVAGYADLQLPAAITCIGARFTFGPYSTEQGAAGILIWKNSISETFPLVPDSPMHLAIGPTSWGFGFFEDNIYTPLASAFFASPLAADGSTVHEAEVIIIDSTAHIWLPDGTSKGVTNPKIAELAGTVASFETFAGIAASTDSKAAFTEVWGS